MFPVRQQEQAPHLLSRLVGPSKNRLPLVIEDDDLANEGSKTTALRSAPCGC